jgi:ribosome-associated toxin RatA of RatAB toxin-antitoxin module
MLNLEVVAQVYARSSNEIYSVIRDFERYSENSEAVRSVNCNMINEWQAISTWEVDFRGGIMRWSEEDYFDPKTCTISFKRTQGDIEYFSGEWKVQEQEQSCLIIFAATFDMGIPSLNHILNPIAAQTLQENIVSIIRGLFGKEVEFFQSN